MGGRRSTMFHVASLYLTNTRIHECIQHNVYRMTDEMHRIWYSYSTQRIGWDAPYLIFSTVHSSTTQHALIDTWHWMAIRKFKNLFSGNSLDYTLYNNLWNYPRQTPDCYLFGRIHRRNQQEEWAGSLIFGAWLAYFYLSLWQPPRLATLVS